MFAKTRWRLVAWTMLVLGVLLLVLGAAVYFAVSRTLLNQVDRNLASRSEQAAPVFEAMARGGPPEREGYRGGGFYLLRDPDGSLVANPPRGSGGGGSLAVAAGGHAGGRAEPGAGRARAGLAAAGASRRRRGRSAALARRGVVPGRAGAG